MAWKCDSSVLFKLPAAITDICPVIETPRDTLPDYGQYLDQMMSCLHPDLLKAFLCSFKEFLKRVHIFLGKIESVQSEIKELCCAQLLEDTFQISVHDKYWKDSYVFPWLQDNINDDNMYIADDDDEDDSRELDSMHRFCTWYEQAYRSCIHCGNNNIHDPLHDQRCNHMPSSIELGMYDCPKNVQDLTVEYDLRKAEHQKELRKLFSRGMSLSLLKDSEL